MDKSTAETELHLPVPELSAERDRLLRAIATIDDDPSRDLGCSICQSTRHISLTLHEIQAWSGKVTDELVTENLDVLYRAQNALEDIADQNPKEREYFTQQARNVAERAKMLLGLLSQVPGLETVYEHANEEFETACSNLIVDLSQITAELIEYFAKHPDELYNLEPRKFEELLEALFRNLGYRAEIGPGWADGGVDLRLFKDDDIGEILTLVQAKRYRIDNPIRIDAVAALAKHVDLENANRGLFVTTSRYLPSTQEFAAKCGHQLTLATSVDVSRWCEEVTGNSAWKKS